MRHKFDIDIGRTKQNKDGYYDSAPLTIIVRCDPDGNGVTVNIEGLSYRRDKVLTDAPIVCYTEEGRPPAVACASLTIDKFWDEVHRQRDAHDEATDA